MPRAWRQSFETLWAGEARLWARSFPAKPKRGWARPGVIRRADFAGSMVGGRTVPGIVRRAGSLPEPFGAVGGRAHRRAAGPVPQGERLLRLVIVEVVGQPVPTQCHVSRHRRVLTRGKRPLMPCHLRAPRKRSA